MENVLRYFFFDVLLAAGLPVAVAYIANWAVVNRFRIGAERIRSNIVSRPNGSRLSCGALKKESSFNILRAPPASSAC